MRKRNGIAVIIFMIAVTAFMLFTAWKGWGPTGTGSMRNIKTGLDLSGGVSITYEADKENPSASDMDDTVYKLQQRVTEYSTEANVYKEGNNRVTVEIPGLSNADSVLKDLGTPGSIYFISQTDKDGNQNYTYGAEGYELAEGKTIESLKKDGSVVCEGTDVSDAQGVVTQDSSTNTNGYAVELTFTKSGTKKFAEATKSALSKGESIGIYYDGEFVSVPNVQSEITNGKAEITGIQSIEEARQLASYIRIGGLKIGLHEIRSNVVGAQLGQEAVKTSVTGGIAGLLLVMAIMIALYLIPGVIASLALLLYAALILVLLNAFDLTLTLPGIAGIILGIGMAVDANVIIYSRIQEEIISGKAVKGAIDSGFRKALGAIIDGNVTTLIAAAVLGMLGTGTIKGFAMTIALGIAVSMLTSLFVSRRLADAFYAAGIRKEAMWARKRKETRFRFVKNAPKFLAAAAAVVCIGVCCMVSHAQKGQGAFNYSLEFIGGTSTTVGFQKDYTLSELDKKVKPVIEKVTGDSDIQMQKVAGSKQVIIKTRTMSMEERETLSESLNQAFKVDKKDITTESISATVGKEMRKNAVLAVGIAVSLMLLYIFVRFRDIRFALSAVLALCHDVLVVLMCYAVFRIPVGGSFIAVMLTILGYSINSTIVIFDRIRENRKGCTPDGYAELVDRSVNQTLTRSINTNLTTFASIFILYLVGVSSIKDFTFPMMAGIIAGFCSSVFLTGPLWYFLKTRTGKHREKKK